MNSQTTLLIASILSFALLANVSVPLVFATGGLDDEEEEEAIKELQTTVKEIQGTLGTIELDLTAGSNDIQANCPSTEEIVQEVVENITNSNNNVTEPEQPVIEQNQTEVTECPIVNEEEPVPTIPNQTVLPPVEAVEPEQNLTEGCQPVQEEPIVVEENQTSSELEPIICPINGELLGYTNTTSGEQLPITAVIEQNNGTIPFLPPIEIIEEEEQQPVIQNQTEVPVTEELPSCNVTEPEQQIAPSIVDEQEIATIEFEASCGCFVVDRSPEEVQ